MKRLMSWAHLEQLSIHTNISDYYHSSLDPFLIQQRKNESRTQWKAIKKKSTLIHRTFLQERVELMARYLCTSEEKAPLAIIKAEASRGTFQNLKDILGKPKTPLTQVYVLLDPDNTQSHHTTLTDRTDTEQNILWCNCRHSLQSLATPFLSDPYLFSGINPDGDKNKFKEILEGTFIETIPSNVSLSPTETLWIPSLKHEISLALSPNDFKKIFSAKQECTSSSPSGQHFGDCKILVECSRQNDFMKVNLILDIAFISLSMASPLHHLKQASQRMLEIGKGMFIENLRIIQLCEADLNFVLHTI